MIGDWNTFFFAVMGTTGTLLGLLFVGISLNVSKIVLSKGLRNAAMQPMILLLGLLITSVFFLAPGQSIFILGVEITATGVVFAAVTFLNDYAVIAKTRKSQRKRYVSNTIANMLPVILVTISGIAMLVHGTSGIYVMIPAIILAFLQIATMSWAFVVDINKQGEGRRWYDESGHNEK